MAKGATFDSTISDIPGITHEQIAITRSKFHERQFPKNHFVGRKGEVCRFTAYVVKGCVSNYRVLSDNGKKVINHFAFEDWWVGDLTSFLHRVPSETYWSTLEETVLMAISKADFDYLMQNIPPFEQFFLKKIQSAFLKGMEKADKDKSETAIERYERMARDYPQILQRVPNYEIAAYLGIAPESLSRIRNQVAKPKKSAS